MWRSPAQVAFLVVLATCFCLSVAAWGSTALVDAPQEQAVAGESPFQEQSGGESGQGATGLLGRKGGAAEELNSAAKGNLVDEPRKKGSSWFGFLSPSEKAESVEVTEGGDRASNELVLEEDGESELGGEKASLEETDDSLAKQKRNVYFETGMESKAKSSERLGEENLRLAGGDAALETLESDGDNPENEMLESRGEESEAETESAEEEKVEKGWQTWNWFAKAKTVNSSKVAAKAPVHDVVTGRANSTEADSLVVEVGAESDEEFEGAEEEEGSAEGATELEDEDSETDDMEGERLGDLRAIILESVARAIKGGNASEAEKLLNDLFSQKREAANASSVAVLPENSTSFPGAQRPSSAAALLESGTEGADESTAFEAKSPNVRTSVWSRLVGGQEESSGGKAEGAQRAANSSASEKVLKTRSGGFWGRLVGGGDKGNSNEAREELLAEPEEEPMGAAGENEEEASEEVGEGLLREPERETVGEVRVSEGEEGEGSTKGPGGGILGDVGNVNSLKVEAFAGVSRGVANEEDELSEVQRIGDTEEDKEEVDKEPALANGERVGPGRLTGAGGSALEVNGVVGQTLDQEEGGLEGGPGVDAPSALNVTTEVARQVPGSESAALNATRNATSFWNASAPGPAVRLVATVQAQTASLMNNITRLTPHAGWGLPIKDPAEEATDGIVSVDLNASAVDPQNVLDRAQTQSDGEGFETGLAGDPVLDEGAYSWFDGEDDTPFSDSVFNLEAVQKQAQEHLVPHVQALSQATSDAYGSTHARIRTTLDGVLGSKASGATATFVVMLLLLVPGVAVVLICQKLKTVFSLQMVIFVCCAYLALHSAVLTLIALVYKDPLALFQRYSPGAYVMLQFLSLLAYVIFLALCTVSCATALRMGELLQRVLGAGQLLPAFGVGVHYFGAVWQPAMVDKPPHVSWTGYGAYTLAFMCICGITWFRRSRHEVLASGGSAYKQM